MSIIKKGVSCHYCFDKHSKEQVKGYAERERQIELARQRGEQHIGQPMQQTMEERRQQKLRFKELQRRAEQGS